MKSMVIILGVVSLIAISFTKCGEDSQTNQSEIQSERSPGGASAEASGNPRVTGLSAKATGPTEISLTWDSVPNAACYWIYRGTYVPAIVRSTSYIDKGLSRDTTYTYAIAAVFKDTLRPKSSPVTVKTPR